jgi:hypothetical protein|tara:strand:- start:496 stop:633 length:138 start_codon:yes stop_codon:yes gene_type:complete
MTPDTREWTGLTEATTLIFAWTVNEMVEIRAIVKKSGLKKLIELP